MAKSKLVKTNEKIAEQVAGAYQKVEDTVVGAYQKVEDTVVGTYTKIEDKFVDQYLTKEGETVEQAKQRLKEENGKRERKTAAGTSIRPPFLLRIEGFEPPFGGFLP